MFKKGEKVYSILKGWGVVEEADIDLRVRFGNIGLYVFEFDGKQHKDNLYPELYHTEPVITVPKRRVEHTGWVAISNKQHLNEKGTTHFRKTSFVYNDEDEARKWILSENDYTFQQITFYIEE